MTKPRKNSKSAPFRGATDKRKNEKDSHRPRSNNSFTTGVNSKPFEKSNSKSESRSESKKPKGKPTSKSDVQKKNPFGVKKRPAGKKPYGSKGYKRREEENLDIQLSDRDAATVATIRRKLQEIREYKRLLAEDGQKPDADDKERESELIVRLLRIEKNAKMEARQRAKAAKTEMFREAAEKAEFAKQKKKSRNERLADSDDESTQDDMDDDDYRPKKSRHRYDDDY